MLPHDLFTQYLTFVKARRRPLTHISYATDLMTFERFRSSVTIRPRKRDIGPGLLDSYLAWLRSRNLASATVERRLQGLKSFFRWAVQRKRVTTDPFALWEIPRAKDPAPRALSPEEDIRLTQLMDAPMRHRFDRMVVIGIRLARFGGLRVGECNGLRWEDTELRLALS